MCCMRNCNASKMNARISDYMPESSLIGWARGAIKFRKNFAANCTCQGHGQKTFLCSIMLAYHPHRHDYKRVASRINSVMGYLLREASNSPDMVRYTPWYSVSHTHTHICAIPHLVTYCAIIVRYHTKTSTNEFCVTIITGFVRYAKYLCWASKLRGLRI